MTTEHDEFRFLASDAQSIGRAAPLPAVSRVEFDLADRRVSGLRFDPDEPVEIVALHGAGLNAHSFDPMLLALDVPALAIDLPGHGRSDWRADADYHPLTLAHDIAALLQRIADAQAGVPFLLVGHSLGGLAAAAAASALVAARPGSLTGLVLVDITPGISPSGNAASVTEFITGQRDYGSIAEIVDRAIAFGIGNDREALTRGVALNTRLRSDGRLEWTHHFAHLDGLPAAGTGDPHPYSALWEPLAGLDVPVALIAGDTGFISEELAAQWRERLPGASLQVLEGPHNLHEAAPRALADSLRERLRT